VEREPLEVLNRIRETIGEYNFAAQYQQTPAPLGGGIVKVERFRTYTTNDLPAKFEMVLQSWDTANKPSELSDYCAGTTWGIQDKHCYLLNVYRKRLGYPDLKRAVKEQAEYFKPETILIEDEASGTQLIQDLVNEGMHEIKKYETTMNKIMRMISVTGAIESGFVHLPDKAPWLGEYLQELMTFPMGRYDDQVDSTSQALDWFKSNSTSRVYGLLEYEKQEAEKWRTEQQSATIPKSRPCSGCDGVMSQRIAGGLRCQQCGTQWLAPQPFARPMTRSEYLDRMRSGPSWRFNFRRKRY
jgi:predicted phage terminase large subunit-like protein